MTSDFTSDTNNSSSDKKNNSLIIIILAFVLFCLPVLIAVLGTPNVTRSRASAKRAACFSNIRTLQGAVEMYNMDNPESMKFLDVDTLVKNKYLKNYPTPPETNCRYSSEGDLTQDGSVYCKFHGNIDPEKEKELKAKERSDEIKSIVFHLLLFIAICSIPSMIRARIHQKRRKLRSSPSCRL